MKTYTIIAGINGVGKSSFTGVLKAERSDLGVIIDVDKITFEGNYNALEAGKIAVKKLEQLLSKGASFTQETTLSEQETEKTVKLAKEKGYKIRLFYIGLNTCEESKKRIKNRVEKGRHDIKSIDVERRFDNRFNTLINILPYCDEAYFFDNENGFIEVAEYKNGEIITKGHNSLNWLNELIEIVKTI